MAGQARSKDTNRIKQMSLFSGHRSFTFQSETGCIYAIENSIKFYCSMKSKIFKDVSTKEGLSSVKIQLLTADKNISMDRSEDGSSKKKKKK